MLTYAGLETFFAYKLETTSFEDDFSTWSTTDRATILFGGLGVAAVSGSIYASFHWNKEINISHHEWSSLVDQLHKNVLEKLQTLEEKERVSHEHYFQRKRKMYATWRRR